MKDEHSAQQKAALRTIINILDPEGEAEAIELEVYNAGYFWRHIAIDEFVATPQLKDELVQIGGHCRHLLQKLPRIRKHFHLQLMMSHHKINFDETDEENPFGDQHLQAIEMIGALCEKLSRNVSVSRGPKGSATRTASWEMATRLFERKTGKTASLGRRADQQISGPWVEYMQAFCEFTAPSEVVGLGSLEAFYKRRSAIVRSGRDPWHELVMGANSRNSAG